MTFSSSGQVTTLGRFAPGVVAQTIGGGGGFGAITAAAGINAPGVSFELGSTGGTGGSADPSNSSTWTIGAGSITTQGVLSDALVAQAIGGGGGLAGFVSGGGQNPPLHADRSRRGWGERRRIGRHLDEPERDSDEWARARSASWRSRSAAAAEQRRRSAFPAAGPVTLGASGGGGGDGGAVTVTSQGAITTSGAGAHAILAQSIGGGGGFFKAFSSAGSLLSPNVVGAAGAGSGGAVTVNVQGAIADERARAPMA